MKSVLLSIWEIVEVGLIAVITVIAVRHFLIQPFVVVGSSMKPTFFSGDYLLIDEISYRYRTPQRGEVVVFRSPIDNKSFFIKRIIGLPEEKILIKDGEIKIFNKENPEGFVLNEPYLQPGVNFSPSVNYQEITLNKDEYFVLGDNRLESFDSRSWGALSKSAIVGLVRVRLWPLTKAKAVEIPVY